MAVQQNKKSPSKRGMHRSHDALTTAALTEDKQTGKVHKLHHINLEDGTYRGRKLFKTKNDE